MSKILKIKSFESLNEDSDFDLHKLQNGCSSILSLFRLIQMESNDYLLFAFCKRFLQMHFPHL